MTIGDGATGRTTFVLADLARSVVAEQEPGQLELFAAVSDRWESGEPPVRRRWGWLGGSVGSGMSPAVLSDIIYPLLTGTFAQVAGITLVTTWRRRRWWRRNRKAAAVAVPTRSTVELSSGQVAAVREACITHGVTLGLSRARATVLADAVHGVLHSALSEPTTPDA